jgi:murein tripeptide amidase MpaA
MDSVGTMIERLAYEGVKPYRVFVYVLVQDIESAERRVQFLRELGAQPFAQPYRDFTTNAEPSRELKDFARWVNDKAIFKSVSTFAEYRGRKK